MKGVILAGGKGTRLLPCTRVTNKHLLPIFNMPMIYYPIKTLHELGITDMLVITGIEHMGAMTQILSDPKNGLDLPIEFTFKVQKKAGGIAEALMLAEKFVGSEEVAVILGDNIFEDNFFGTRARFLLDEQDSNGCVFLKEVPDPERFGVAQLSKEGDEIMSIEEKPAKPKSNLAVTGLYFYRPAVFEDIKRQKYSARGELEITDTNSRLVAAGEMIYQVVEGFWSDAGTWESLMIASMWAAGYESEVWQ